MTPECTNEHHNVTMMWSGRAWIVQEIGTDDDVWFQSTDFIPVECHQMCPLTKHTNKKGLTSLGEAPESGDVCGLSLLTVSISCSPPFGEWTRLRRGGMGMH